MEIFDCEQGSVEWFECRRGIPTASQFGTLLMSGRGGSESKTRKTYLYKLAGEIMTGEPMDSFSNVHTERGHAMEPEARDFYAFQTDCEPQQVGFIRNGQCGASPDSLIGSDGLLEIKTKLPHILIDLLIADDFPREHMAQCQGQLWVAEREWLDLVCYWPKMPKFIKRVRRDEAFIKQLSEAVDQFNDELLALVARLQSEGIAA